MKNDLQNQPKAVVDLIKSIMEKTLEENKSSTGYELYHKDFSSAMKHAYAFAKKKYGIDIDPKEIDDKVATGPRKPTSGKTNSYRLLDKDGKKAVQIQVYNMDNKKYELNMYKEEVELSEGKMTPDQIDKLKKSYESLRGKKISAEMGMKISRELEKLDKNAAIEIAKADIPFVSTLAINKLMMNFNMSGAAIKKIIGESAAEIVELTQAEYERKLAAKNQSRDRNNEEKDKEVLEEIEGLKNKSEKSGIAYSILKKVYDRGMAAWKSGHRPGTTPQQWAFARVNSFITGGGARKADNDLWSKHKGNSPKKEGTAMKRFGTFMNEATGGMKMIGAADELEKYSKKSGGIDKKDFMKAVKLMRQGMSDKLVDFTNDLDTEPREKIVDVVANHIGVKAAEKMFKVKFINRSEEVEEEFSPKEIKMAIGIASDKRYKGGNMTGAVQAIEKIKKGLSNDKQVSAVLRRQNEEFVNESKMKDLALDIDNVYKGMQKNFVMKSFADKFKQDVSKTMNIRKSLEKILPDYVSGKDIQKLMASHCVSEEKVVCPECDGKGCEHCNDKGYHMKDEELSAKQKKIDINKNGKVDGADLAKLRAKKESFEFSDLVENSDKEDAKEMSDVVKELDPKVKVAELKKRVYDMAMEKYKNKSRANKIAGMVK